MSVFVRTTARGGLAQARRRPAPIIKPSTTPRAASPASTATAPPVIGPEQDAPTPTANAAQVSPAHRWTSLFFALALLVGLACRLYGLNWDQNTSLHPDERFYLDTASKLRGVHSWGEFFDSSRSPLNPANYVNVHFVYGQLPLFLFKMASALFPTVAPVLLGRALSGAFDALTVLFTVLIARRLFGTRDGYFAGALVALAALHIQLSHFFTTDTFAAAFMTASFWAGVRFLDTKRPLDATLMGLCWGFAMACKISALLFGVAALAFLAFGLWSQVRERQGRSLVLSLLGSGAATVLAFRVGHPMGFRGETWGGIFDLHLDPRFWDELKTQGAITRGEVDVPFNVQWVGTKPWLFPFENLGRWGYGWPLWLSGLAGLALLMILAVRRRRATTPERLGANTLDARLFPVLTVAALLFVTLFGVQGGAFSKFSRYYLPLTPLVALLATFFWRGLARKNPRLEWGTALVALCTLLWCLAVTSIYGSLQPRLVASLWVVQNIPPGTPVAQETGWDETLPIGWAPATDKGVQFNSQIIQTFDLDTEQKRQNMERILDESEWIFFTSGRSWQDIPRWPAKWPVMSAFYQALWAGKLGFHIEREFTNYPHLGPWQFPDYDVEEALTVYDHPRVILWRKNQDYSSQKMRAILNAAPLAPAQNWQPREAK